MHLTTVSSLVLHVCKPQDDIGSHIFGTKDSHVSCSAVAGAICVKVTKAILRQFLSNSWDAACSGILCNAVLVELNHDLPLML